MTQLNQLQSDYKLKEQKTIARFQSAIAVTLILGSFIIGAVLDSRLF